MMEREPGLRIDLPWKNVRTLKGEPYPGPGTEVEIIRGPFKGMRGHIQFTGYNEDVRVRTGDKAAWDAYDADTQRLLDEHRQTMARFK